MNRAAVAQDDVQSKSAVKGRPSTPERAEPTDSETVGAFLRRILGSRWKSCPRWPPDLFGATASLLRQTGVYTRTLEIPDDGHPPLLEADWPSQARASGSAWRQSFADWQPSTLPKPPAEVRAWWDKLLEAHECAIVDLWGASAHEKCTALVKLCCVSDEASSGAGMGLTGSRCGRRCG